ncbi:N-alpha-acetyltransferase 20 [Drosophila busckii]|nr:N-alpha-acetyltransferase 20 [Drosophila busckii]
MFKFNRLAWDPFIEDYNLSFFVTKMLQFPMLSQAVLAPNEQLMGYLLGESDKAAAGDHQLYGHVSVLAVDSEYRRLGVGSKLLERFHQLMEQQQKWYVSLYVRMNNRSAMRLYESLGYVKYSWLPNFYPDDHGYSLRLPLATDVAGKTLQGQQFIIKFYFIIMHVMLLIRAVLKFVLRH